MQRSSRHDFVQLVPASRVDRHSCFGMRVRMPAHGKRLREARTSGGGHYVELNITAGAVVQTGRLNDRFAECSLSTTRSNCSTEDAVTLEWDKLSQFSSSIERLDWPSLSDQDFTRASARPQRGKKAPRGVAPWRQLRQFSGRWLGNLGRSLGAATPASADKCRLCANANTSY
jgi:hypothetical protein